MESMETKPTTYNMKEALKGTKLNPVQKMGLTKRFKERIFSMPSKENDKFYEVIFGQNKIVVRAHESGLLPDEMDAVADILTRGRRNEQKSMIDMLTLIQVLPLAQETLDVLIEEWKQNGVEANELNVTAEAQA